MNKFINTIFGVLLVAWGVILIFDRGYFSEKYRHYIDFGPYHYVFGLILLVCGGAILLSVVRRKKTSDEKVVICPSCGRSYNQQDVPRMECPTCQVELEDLKGFYDRHPDLR